MTTEEEIESKVSASPPPSSSSSSKRRNKIKESKSKRKAELRKKNLGLGIGNIDVNAKPNKSTKIKFDDDYEIDQEEEDEDLDVDVKKDEKIVNQNVGSDDDDDDDDEVEQVSASAAKNEALQMLAAERETRKVENALTHKRKRRKKKVVDILAPSSNQTDDNDDNNDDDDDDDDLDEEFLSMVDTARATDSKMKKLKKESNVQLKKMGRHTTFVSEESEAGAMKAIHADHNIDIVVLPLSNATRGGGVNDEQESSILQEKAELSLSSDLSTTPSNAALLLCRGTHNMQGNSGGSKQYAVKRSRKMKYKMSLGRPSSNFAVRRKKRD